jgi:hypothetical protein
MRRIFNLKAFNGISSNDKRSPLKSVPIAATYSGKGNRMGARGTRAEAPSDSLQRNQRTGRGEVSWWERNDGELSGNESEEYIVGNGKMDVPLEIWESRQVDVETASVDPRLDGRLDLKSEQNKIYDGLGHRSPSEFETTTTIQVVPKPIILVRD